MISRKTISPAIIALSAFAGFSLPAHAQAIGSYDNFDTFNNTGQEAEGFEIDIEDVGPGDITRIFPDNFPNGQPYIRYATPDKAALTLVDFGNGHTGVRIVYAASYVGGQWVTAWGSSTVSGTPIGNGTPFVANPTLTLGDSCWTQGLGTAYPTSGCDHFGISLAGGKVPGKITYHWLVPDPNIPGQLVQSGTLVAIPPSPVLALNPPVAGQPPVVHAVAEAPENPEPQWGDATWVKTTTFYGNQRADLNQLQKMFIKQAKTRKVVSWSLLQQPPAGQAGEKADVEDDQIPAKAVQVTKQYEYFGFGSPKNGYKANGFNTAVAYDSETHEALCDLYASQADAAAGTNPVADCTKPHNGSYWVQDPIHGAVFVKGGNLGSYLGAHINAYNAQ